MQNTLYTGDNLYFLNGMNSETIDLIYLDPPFNSKRIYSAPSGSKAAGASFKDIWTWSDVDTDCLDGLEIYPELAEYIYAIGKIHSTGMMSYITFMTQRIIQMHRVLKNTGSLYLHCDPVASHYLKIVLDEVFGQNNFMNEIIWCYRKWTNTANLFQKNHDTILFYAKSRGNHTFNKLFDTETSQRKHYQIGYHTNVIKGVRQLIVYDREKAARKITHGGYDKIVYREDQQKVSMPDFWEIPILNSQAKERTGYPTQKPLALLHRIIEASSNAGDVVFDPFCGCATTCVAAQQTQRQWIGIDIESKAADLLVQRLSGKSDTGDRDILFKDFIHTDKIPHRTDIKEEKPSAPIKDRLFKAQKGLCSGCEKPFDSVNFEIDHIFPKSKGGGDYYENFQLLCGNCNRVKGDRPMEYLVAKLRARDEVIKNVSY